MLCMTIQCGMILILNANLFDNSIYAFNLPLLFIYGVLKITAYKRIDCLSCENLQSYCKKYVGSMMYAKRRLFA